MLDNYIFMYNTRDLQIMTISLLSVILLFFFFFLAFFQQLAGTCRTILSCNDDRMNPHLIPDPKGLSLLLYFLQCWLLFEIALIMLFFHNNEFFFQSVYIYKAEQFKK